MNASKQNRECHRLVVAADSVAIDLWRIRRAGAPLREPSSHALKVRPTVINMGADGFGLSLFRGDAERLRLCATDPVGLVIEYEGQRLMCAAEVRYALAQSDGTTRVGLRFTFDPTSAEQRQLRKSIQSMYGALERKQLRQRAIYGPAADSAAA